ncbi:transporter substrate-binding domain-containing protein [Thalassotalea sp. M1531]|uniref:Transporter substrate-binding domain-containing protein n=1 Tax=Thalassotalea algicola TaxID=2716224 RepID=A0A7Y0Q6T1_9GAMM|nr:transporter substrate-binding domain-containing protein [Thalassotalea algicola]NMP31157.1 transporter substrate-binding domain-containing protein [Thalassotalea algicola]
MNIRSLIIAVTLSFLSVSTYSKSTDLVACIDDHPPYQILADKPYGTHISALETLASALNKQLVFVKSPNFARCVALLKTGEVDVIAGLNRSKEREKFAFYAPFKVADERIVISTKDVFIEEYGDFQGKIIGVPRGTTYFNKFDNDKSLNKVSIHTIRTGLELLLKNRIDMIITSPYVIDSLLTDIKKAKLKITKLNLQNSDTDKTHFGFSKKNKLNLSQEEIVSIATNAFEQSFN